MRARVAAVIDTLREFAPYLVVILPGGSLIALLWWAYRRQGRWRDGIARV
jgi:cbb3-type cytochrome oxidase subunit 3